MLPSMKLTYTFLLGLFLVGTVHLSAQDLHYSLYNMAPTMVNPAQTGAYEGTARVGGIYRSQWSFLEFGYQTPMFYLDAPLFYVGKRDWVGAGLTAYQDQAGTLGLKNGAFLLAAAYHHALDKKSKNVITLGVQGGSVQRGLSDEFGQGGRVAVLPSDLNGGIPGPNPIDMIQDESAFDLNAGIYFRSNIDKKSNFNAGVALHHILTPNYSLISPNTGGGGGGGSGNNPNAAQLPVRVSVHGGYDRVLNDKWSINPTALFMLINNQNQFNLQTWAGYKVNEEKDFTLRFGLGYRLGRDGELLLGADVGDFRIAGSFDLALSQFQDIADTQSAFEVGASYIIKIYKTPDLPPVILCPPL